MILSMRFRSSRIVFLLPGALEVIQPVEKGLSMKSFRLQNFVSDEISSAVFGMMTAAGRGVQSLSSLFSEDEL